MVLREQFGGHHLAINSSAEILSYDVEKDGLARPFLYLEILSAWFAAFPVT
jgi:hypothetical protein